MTASEFKAGDRVRIKVGANNLYMDYTGPGEGKVQNPNYPTLPSGSPYTVLVAVNGGVGKLFRAEDLELITATKDNKIADALKQTKKDLGLCEEFDQAVEEAKNLPLVKRLEYVARDRNEQSVFDHFLSVLNKPEYVMPEVPAKGDYVRLTMANGDVKEGEVESTEKNQEGQDYPQGFTEINLNKGIVYIFHCQQGFNYYNWANERKVVKVEHITKPVEIPEVGKWIAAVTQDGKTHTFEVTENDRSGDKVYLWNGKTSPLGNGYRPAINGSYSGCNIVSWDYVPAPVKPVETEGWWIAPSTFDPNRIQAFKTREDAVSGLGALTDANNVSEAYTKIARYSQTTGLRQYIPALLAIIKFIEQEESTTRGT